jgi:hypothetical protein
VVLVTWFELSTQQQQFSYVVVSQNAEVSVIEALCSVLPVLAI